MNAEQLIFLKNYFSIKIYLIKLVSVYAFFNKKDAKNQTC